mgnify:CR=1 FL=1
MGMTQANQLGIAAIGDEELVNGLRLAGISRYYIIRDDHNTREDVRNAISKVIGNPDVAVVVMLEDYAEYAKDLLIHLREEKKMTPIVIEVPSKFGTKYKDVVGFYKAFIRESIGFEVEI